MNARYALMVRYGISAFAMVFGLVTIISGGQVIFGSELARSAAGNYLPFIVWFNFLAGFAYVGAAVGLATRQAWAGRLALAIVVATAIAFLAFGILVLTGASYEPRTAGAMTLRTVVWAGIAWFALRSSGRT